MQYKKLTLNGVIVINKDFQLTNKKKKGPKWSGVNKDLMNENKMIISLATFTPFI